MLYEAKCEAVRSYSLHSAISSHANGSPIFMVKCFLQQLQPIAAQRLLLLTGWRAFCKSWAWQRTHMPSRRCELQILFTTRPGSG